MLTKSAYLLRVDSHTLLFAADSCNISPKMYEHVQRELGDVEVLFVGMECDGAPVSWIYGPLLTQHLERPKDQSRRLAGSNFERAIAMVEQFRLQRGLCLRDGSRAVADYIMQHQVH